MGATPAGTHSFLFTDIEGSTRLVQRLGARYPAVLTRHRAVLAEAFGRFGGVTQNAEGDATFVVFDTAPAAVRGSLAVQDAIAAEPWPDDGIVRVRIGIHTGEAIRSDAGFVGLAVHHGARVGAAAHGGQVLLTQATCDAVGSDFPAGCGLRDLGMYRLKDLAAPQRLYQLTHPRLRDDFPAPRSLDFMPHNLPVQITTFIGRDAEMQEVTQLLAGSRLLTLTGSGGCGKTRLSEHVAADLVEEYADGVWLVELAPLVEPEQVALAAASVFGVAEEAGRAVDDTLADALRSRHLLLVLDNCEHLVGACAELVAALLRSCRDVQVLATSQEPLGVPGETVFRVPSLAVPPDTTIASVDQLPAFDAVRLFVDRAVLARRDFALTPANADAVSQLCRRLDGIPLAIELAAARISVVPPQQIAERLDDRFRLLAGGRRGALPRHQTLRAAVDWSYDLLGEAEQVLLRRLSVFAAGWSLDAAEQVAGLEPLEPPDVLDALARLVGRSLVVAEEHGGVARYRLLETIRQYAREKLVAAGEIASLRTRHLEWFHQLALTAEPELTGPEQATWFTHLALEHDNLRSALEWAAAHPAGGATLLSLSASLWRFWLVRGSWSEGRAWLGRALDTNGPAPAATRARALAAAGDLATEQGDYDEAAKLLEDALTAWRALGESEGIAKALNHLGNLARARSDYAAARAFLNEALERRARAGNERGRAVSLRNLGRVAFLERDHDTARALYEQALPVARQLGEKRVMATITHELATVAFEDGDRVTTRRLAEEGLAICKELGDQQGIAKHLTILAGLAAGDGDEAAAATLLDAALNIWHALGSRSALATSHTTLGLMALARGDFTSAAAHFEAALAGWRAIGDAPAVARLMNLAGWSAAMAGDTPRAVRLLSDGVQAARALGDPLQLAATLHSLGEVERLQGHTDAARELLVEADHLAGQQSLGVVQWAPRYSLGALARAAGDLDEADGLLRTALAACPHVGGGPHVAECLDELAAVAHGRGDDAAAARLLGGADSVRARHGCPVPPVRAGAYQVLVDGVRAALSHEDFTAAFVAGQSAGAGAADTSG
jgi:predicted ATPase/class 3 adenylate cyclase